MFYIVQEDNNFFSCRNKDGSLDFWEIVSFLSGCPWLIPATECGRYQYHDWKENAYMIFMELNKSASFGIDTYTLNVPVIVFWILLLLHKKCHLFSLDVLICKKLNAFLLSWHYESKNQNQYISLFISIKLTKPH